MTESRPVSPEGPAPLDCPFCGEVARLHAAAISLGFYRVGCNNPNCIQPEAFADEKVDAIARWNRRPSRSAGSPETAPAFNELEHFALRLDAIAESLNTSALDMAIADLRKLARQRAASSAPSPGEAAAPTPDTKQVAADAGLISEARLSPEQRAALTRLFAAALSGDREDSIPVTINGLTVRVPRFVSYADVVRLAGYAPERVLSVVYHQPSGRSGTLSPKSDNVEATAGTRFSVADTSNA